MWVPKSILELQICSKIIRLIYLEKHNLDAFASGMSGLIKMYPNPASDVIHATNHTIPADS
jgi:hypothetical protein